VPGAMTVCSSDKATKASSSLIQIGDGDIARQTVMCSPWSFPHHPARRIFTLRSAYYVLMRRYRCTECASAATEEVDKKKTQTFMVWDSNSLPLISFGHGPPFPAYLTFKSGIDKSLLDLLCALTSRGIQPETFSEILTKMHATKHYSNEMIDREYLLASLLSSSDYSAEFAGTAWKGTLFSNFDDKQKYNGRIPLGKYFKNLFIWMTYRERKRNSPNIQVM
jgi:hypothetical protein